MLITSPSDHSRRRMAAIGTFDGVHLGHRALLSQLAAAARRRGLATAAVTFAGHPRRALCAAAPPPMLMTPRQRAEALMAVGAADVVMLDFDERLRRLTAADFLRELRERFSVEALLLGYNNRFGHDRPEGLAAYQAIGREAGVAVEGASALTLDGGGEVSSSAIRQLLLTGRPADAARLLGRPYRLAGTVVRGEGLGRTLGYPTANIQPADAALLIPAEGAYAATVSIGGGDDLPAMLDIGRRPSVAAAGAPLTIEAHLLLPVGDIYGAEVAVAPTAYLRPERKFGSLDELRRQLDADAAAVKALFGL